MGSNGNPNWGHFSAMRIRAAHLRLSARTLTVKPHLNVRLSCRMKLVEDFRVTLLLLFRSWHVMAGSTIQTAVNRGRSGSRLIYRCQVVRNDNCSFLMAQLHVVHWCILCSCLTCPNICVARLRVERTSTSTTLVTGDPEPCINYSGSLMNLPESSPPL